VKFFLDHDVPVEVARVLRQEGHEVTELREVLPIRASDVEAFSYAREHGGPDLRAGRFMTGSPVSRRAARRSAAILSHTESYGPSIAASLEQMVAPATGSLVLSNCRTHILLRFS
jgi:hypothetical protein